MDALLKTVSIHFYSDNKKTAEKRGEQYIRTFLFISTALSVQTAGNKAPEGVMQVLLSHSI